MSLFKVGFVIFPDLTQLDFTGPQQVLARLPNSAMHIVAKSKHPVPSDPIIEFLRPGGCAIVARYEAVTVNNFNIRLCRAAHDLAQDRACREARVRGSPRLFLVAYSGVRGAEVAVVHPPRASWPRWRTLDQVR